MLKVRQCMIGETAWFRKLEGEYHTMAVAAGAKDLKEAHAFAKRLTNAQLKELGCPKRKDVHGNVVEGEYVCPSYNAFYHLLRHRDKAGRYDFDVADYAARLSKWTTAQAGRLPRHLAADGKFVDEVVGLVSPVPASRPPSTSAACSRRIPASPPSPGAGRTTPAGSLADVRVKPPGNSLCSQNVKSVLEAGNLLVSAYYGRNHAINRSCKSSIPLLMPYIRRNRGFRTSMTGYFTYRCTWHPRCSRCCAIGLCN